MLKALSLMSFFMLAACASVSGPLPKLQHYTSNSCEDRIKKFESGEVGGELGGEVNDQLDLFSDLYDGRCLKETLWLGRQIRDQRRDKFYSVTSEFAELFLPDGSLSDYVLESYERSYLSIVMALSYLQLGQVNDAQTELRRSQSEEVAVLYNFGDDPVITLLLATLWDRFDTNESRPYWQKLEKNLELPPALQKAAVSRLVEIDGSAGDSHINWDIYQIGVFPEVDWHPNFLGGSSGTFRIFAKSLFPSSCQSKTSVVISTESWLHKIAAKYDNSYHPLLFAKSLLRLPVGVTYGIVGVSTGLAVGVGGCAAAASLKDSGGGLCQISAEAAGYLIGKSADLVAFTLKPDLRHWAKVPAAVLISREPLNVDDPCVGTQNAVAARPMLLRPASLTPAGVSDTVP